MCPLQPHTQRGGKRGRTPLSPARHTAAWPTRNAIPWARGEALCSHSCTRRPRRAHARQHCQVSHRGREQHAHTWRCREAVLLRGRTRAKRVRGAWKQAARLAWPCGHTGNTEARGNNSTQAHACERKSAAVWCERRVRACAFCATHCACTCGLNMCAHVCGCASAAYACACAYVSRLQGKPRDPAW